MKEKAVATVPVRSIAMSPLPIPQSPILADYLGGYKGCLEAPPSLENEK
jgi:hypothetical protein